MRTYNVVQGEANTLTMTVTDADGSAIDVSGATIEMWVKRELDQSSSGYLVTKGTDDFTVNVGSASNVVSVVVDITWPEPTVYAIVKFTISATNIKKGVFKLKLVQSPE